MMLCNNCGKGIPSNSTACSFCGASFEAKMRCGAENDKIEYKTAYCCSKKRILKRRLDFFKDLGWRIVELRSEDAYEQKETPGLRYRIKRTRILMSRDTSIQNYERIRELSQKAEDGHFRKPKPNEYSAVMNNTVLMLWLIGGLVAFYSFLVKELFSTSLDSLFVPMLTVGISLLLAGTITKLATLKRVREESSKQSAVDEEIISNAKKAKKELIELLRDS